MQTKIFKISSNIVSKVLRNKMLEESKLGALCLYTTWPRTHVSRAESPLRSLRAWLDHAEVQPRFQCLKKTLGQVVHVLIGYGLA